MRICVDMGHTSASPGAYGILDELAEDRRIGSALIAELRARGHEVVDSTADDWLAYPDEVNDRVAKANAADPDLVVSVHLNCSDPPGTGTECLYWYTDGAGLDYATRISRNVASCLGIADRGAKPNFGSVGVVRDIAATVALVEVCFVNRPEDASAYRAETPQHVAKAIADGIEGREYRREAEVRRALQYQPNLTAAQRFRIVDCGDGYCTVESVLDGTVLDVYGGSTRPMENGREVVLWEANGTPAQKWRVENLPNGAVMLHSALDETYVLEAAGGRLANGYLQLWREQAAEVNRWAQTWRPMPCWDGGSAVFLLNGKSLNAMDANPHGLVL